MSDPSCTVCRGTWPGRALVIGDLGLSMAYLNEDQYFPGWTVLVFKRHATELFHLAPTERIQLMEEVSRLAKVLAETFTAAKMNYELLGNQIPHIHWHVIPRLPRDPSPLQPIWGIPHDLVVLSEEEIRTTISRIQKGLGPSLARA
jgi:diadenosine tetraphosphate (Ap4A) HIT family hydrolase